MGGYNYYNGSNPVVRFNRQAAQELSLARFSPSLKDQDYLVYVERKKHFSRWISLLKNEPLDILDVGGRIQPYRPLLRGRIGQYVAIDPIFEGLVDIVSVGEDLPFVDQVFDVVICTQVLGYVTSPAGVVNEIYRVLKPGGALLLSVPALSPRNHDERWRFFPEGIEVLLRGFSSWEIVPEGYSIAGVFRTINIQMNSAAKGRRMKKCISNTIVPCFNIAGKKLDRLSHGSQVITTNYSAFALK